MTSTKVMLKPVTRLDAALSPSRRWAVWKGHWVCVLIGLLGCLAGCTLEKPVPPLKSPYPGPQVWAIAPLANQSGSLHADGLAMADQLHRQLGNAVNLQVVPVNRVIQAMEAHRLRQISTVAQARLVLQTLGVDALVVGTLSAYDPYDPPKISLILELYTLTPLQPADLAHLRHLAGQPTDPTSSDTYEKPPASSTMGPLASVSAVLDASDPATRTALEKYGVQRGPQAEPEAWRRYRISIDLYSEFAAYVMSYRLLDIERRRLNPETDKPADETPGWLQAVLDHVEAVRQPMEKKIQRILK